MSAIPGPLSSKVSRRPLRGSIQHFHQHGPAAAVNKRVTRQFAGGRNHLGLIHQAEPQSTVASRTGADGPYDVGLGSHWNAFS